VLSGLRILELADDSGELAGKILADLGAEVVKVEPPGGSPSRATGPFLGQVADRERGLGWLARNTGKRSVVIDLTSQADRARFESLVAGADAVLESGAAQDLDRAGLGAQALRARHPRLVWCSISPFGRSGPHADHRGHDLVAVAMGGNAAMTGEPTAAPLRCTMPTAYFHAGPEAACALLVALYARERHGCGDFIDVSLQECQLGSLLSAAGQFRLTGLAGRRAGARIGRTREIWRCKDGYVTFGLRGGPARVRNLEATCDYMAEHGMLPDWMRDYDWPGYNHNHLTDEEIERFERAYGDFFATKTMRELYDQALQRRILLAPCNDAREILEHVQLRSRELFQAIAYPHLDATIEHPAFFAKSDRPGIGVRGRAPRLAEHDGIYVDGWPARGADVVAVEAASKTTAAGGAEPSSGDLAFSGLRIVEFGSGVAGPMATRYFAERGAVVVRVESRARPDFLRLLHLSKDNPHGLDGAPMFVLLNANKRSLTLDLGRPESREIARRLIDWADVVCENFAPGVMAKWGLDAASLRARQPRLIYVSSCLFGQTGPQRGYPGFGGQGAAIAGFNHLTGYAGGAALGPYGTITDSLSPRFLGALVAAALIERRRTGVGRTIDLSQIEVGVYSLSEMIVRRSASGEILSRAGNRDEHAAPHGIYPCSGDDRWIAIAVFDDTAWRSLVREMGSPDWARAPELSTLDARLARVDELDARVGQWTSTHDAGELMARLQAAGVEAGVVQTFADLDADPQLAHRQHFVDVDHPHLGRIRCERAGFRSQRNPDCITAGGPDIGAHTREVLRDLLGMSDAAIDELERQEALR